MSGDDIERIRAARREWLAEIVVATATAAAQEVWPEGEDLTWEWLHRILSAAGFTPRESYDVLQRACNEALRVMAERR